MLTEATWSVIIYSSSREIRHIWPTSLLSSTHPSRHTGCLFLNHARRQAQAQPQGLCTSPPPAWNTCPQISSWLSPASFRSLFKYPLILTSSPRALMKGVTPLLTPLAPSCLTFLSGTYCHLSPYTLSLSPLERQQRVLSVFPVLSLVPKTVPK